MLNFVMILNTRHVALVVTDMEKAISLYKDLGADLRSRDLEEGKFIEDLIGIRNVVIETCKLHFYDNSRLELIQFIRAPHFLRTTQDNKGDTKIELKRAGGEKFGLNNNINHIAFTVKDIAKSIKIIEQYGGRLHSEPVISTAAHSKYAVRAKHSYIFDPFGNLLHLAQDLELGKIQ